MIKRVKYSDTETLQSALQRPEIHNNDTQDLVQQVFREVRLNGEKAIAKYNGLFDGYSSGTMCYDKDEIEAQSNKVPKVVQTAIQCAAKNIEQFHNAQMPRDYELVTMPGVKCWRKSVGIDSVGLYVPGGTAPLFSTVLMLGIPAKIAECTEVILCTPGGSSVNPAIMYAAKVCGISKVYGVGGIQAVAAMTYGTEIVPQVNKIFGPGNQYVTAAKQFAQTKGVAIDMPAGPSEVMVVADETCPPEFVAADLLSQAEHGLDSQVILVASKESVIDAVEEKLYTQLSALPRKEIAKQALNNSVSIKIENWDEAIDLINGYAPEHLILATKNASALAGQVRNAGSVFIGKYTPESAGDYASGTNHTLPTNGFAKAYSGVSVESFVKHITFQELTANGLRSIGPTIETMADAEQMEAHKNAVRIRLEKIESDD